MHPLFDRLENVRLLNAPHLNAVRRELLLWQPFQGVVGTVDLLTVVLEQLFDLLLDRR
jgi:hypothetical protein